MALPVPGALIMRRAPNDPDAAHVAVRTADEIAQLRMFIDGGLIPSSLRGKPIRGQNHRIQIEVVTAKLEALGKRLDQLN